MVERAALVEYKTIISSSPRWRELPHRAGDIVVCTPPKVGTTWTQGIVRSLIAGHEEPAGSIPIDAPWIDSRFEPIDTVVARLEAQTHRRCIKSHTPADGIPLFADSHYIAVYRGGLDSFMSWVNHWNGMRMENMGAMIDDAIADGVDLTALPPPARPPPPRRRAALPSRMTRAPLVNEPARAMGVQVRAGGGAPVVVGTGRRPWPVSPLSPPPPRASRPPIGAHW